MPDSIKHSSVQYRQRFALATSSVHDFKIGGKVQLHYVGEKHLWKFVNQMYMQVII